MTKTIHSHHGHEETVQLTRGLMPKEELLYDLAELYKVFGDTTRIKILLALYENEMCVCGIAELLNMTQSAISHQLKALRVAKLVRSRKDGKVAYYSLDDEHVNAILAIGLQHVEEE